jgi:hypothetical protein
MVAHEHGQLPTELARGRSSFQAWPKQPEPDSRIREERVCLLKDRVPAYIDREDLVIGSPMKPLESEVPLFECLRHVDSRQIGRRGTVFLKGRREIGRVTAGIALGWPGSWVTIVWNLFGLAMLVNAIGTVATSTPGPIHLDWPGEPFTMITGWAVL